MCQAGGPSQALRLQGHPEGAHAARHASLHKAKRNIKRVDTEVRALKRFSHAAVVRLCDVIQSPAHVYLILERGDQDLYAFLDEASISARKPSPFRANSGVFASTIVILDA